MDINTTHTIWKREHGIFTHRATPPTGARDFPQNA